MYPDTYPSLAERDQPLNLVLRHLGRIVNIKLARMTFSNALVTGHAFPAYRTWRGNTKAIDIESLRLHRITVYDVSDAVRLALSCFSGTM